jgi:carbon storage regulator
MLVLSRKPGERLRLGDEITLTVLRVDGQRVRIGIDAPSEVRILRDELRQPLAELHCGRWKDLSVTVQT